MARGRCLEWDATIANTTAASHLPATFTCRHWQRSRPVSRKEFIYRNLAYLSVLYSFQLQWNHLDQWICSYISYILFIRIRS